MTSIRIGTIHGRVDVEAEVFGPLAIHPTPEGLWGVTHVRTGRSVARRDSREEALALVGRLLPLADWSRLDGRAVRLDHEPTLTDEQRRQIRAVVEEWV